MDTKTENIVIQPTNPQLTCQFQVLQEKSKIGNIPHTNNITNIKEKVILGKDKEVMLIVEEMIVKIQNRIFKVMMITEASHVCLEVKLDLGVESLL